MKRTGKASLRRPYRPTFTSDRSISGLAGGSARGGRGRPPRPGPVLGPSRKCHFDGLRFKSPRRLILLGIDLDLLSHLQLFQGSDVLGLRVAFYLDIKLFWQSLRGHRLLHTDNVTRSVDL